MRAEQGRSEGEFANGLRAWLSGDGSLEAEAAGEIVAETILLHRAWIKAHAKKD